MANLGMLAITAFVSVFESVFVFGFVFVFGDGQEGKDELEGS